VPDLQSPTLDPPDPTRAGEPERRHPATPPHPRPDRHWAAASAGYYPSFTHTVPSAGAVSVARSTSAITAALWLAFVLDSLRRLSGRHPSALQVAWIVLILLAVTTLCFSSVMYQVGRAAALGRLRTHRRTTRADLDRHFRFSHATMTVLVPSSAEEPKVVRATLWSAALQEFPRLRLVLLLDDRPSPTDPTDPTDPAARAGLAATRRLPGEIARRLEDPRRFCTAALERFRAAPGPEVSVAEVRRLVDTYERAALWLRDLAADESLDDHADAFLVDRVVLGLAEELLGDAEALREGLARAERPGAVEMLDRHRRLVRLFSVETDLFERRRYASLPQAAGKAMNLNSYLALMGRVWRTARTRAGDILLPAPDGVAGDVAVPDADYVLALDAGSLLVRDYCLRLVHELEQPGNEDVAVIQTPDCAIPGAPTMVEQVAGASTDLQHLHQLGTTAFDATLWIGANAVIRRPALDEIVTEHTERGFRVRTYLQDRTALEDVESSLDLAARGWRLLNYPERLSYRATPPDFGSLVAQRRRRAGGGLIILPRIRDVVLARRVRGQRVDPVGVMLRVDHLGSTAWTCLAAILLLLLPAAVAPVSPLLLVTAAPFLAVRAADLRRVGHEPVDVLWVQALDLALLPVDLAGVLTSLRQAAARGRTTGLRRSRQAAPRSRRSATRH